MLSYSLSNRQRDALRDGTGLQIAIPVSFDTPPDAGPSLDQWYAAALPDIPAGIRRGPAELAHVWCHALNRGGVVDSPQSLWGELLDDQTAQHRAVVRVAVVVVTLSPARPITTRPIRWPAGPVFVTQ